MLKLFARFRLSSNKLEIESGRFIGTQRAYRHCKICSSPVVEDECHVLLCLPKYEHLRRKHIGYISRPNTYHFIKLMSSLKNKNFAFYVQESFRKLLHS